MAAPLRPGMAAADRAAASGSRSARSKAAVPFPPMAEAAAQIVMEAPAEADVSPYIMTTPSGSVLPTRSLPWAAVPLIVQTHFGEVPARSISRAPRNRRSEEHTSEL